LTQAVSSRAAGREPGRRWRLAEGEEIAPRLHALRHLGGGHHYEVYVAFDERLHSIVVAKLVRPRLVDDEHTLRGLRAEAAMLNRLAHPAILRSFGGTLEGDRPHLVLEHVEGPRLSTLIRRYGPLAADQLVPLGVQLCSTLHYLREEGVVHLDLKPANVIMSGPPRLIDLSVALAVDEAAVLHRPLGTDNYMAPEQCDPVRRGPVGPAADVFGLGVILYRAATGERPFPVGDSEAVGPARWPQLELGPAPLERKLPGRLVRAILSCLEPNPAARPAPAELSDELETLLGEQPRPRLAALKPRWN
jgi:serine/threonine protein kinase